MVIYHDLAHQGARQGAVFAPHRIVHEPPRGIRYRCSPRRGAVWCQRCRRGVRRAFGGWVLAKQNEYDVALGAMICSVKVDGNAALGLLGLSFRYWVFHAAGRGTGQGSL
jgi:hypothetical protein